MNSSKIINNVKKLMDINNVGEKELSKQLNISLATMKKKINGDSKFYINEIEKIKEIFELDTDTFARMFFNSKSNQEKLKIKDKS